MAATGASGLAGAAGGDLERPVLYTIGHSAHPPERFVALLLRHGVVTVVDVRSLPYSHYHAHFRRAALESLLPTAGLRYVYLGRELGGRPSGRHLMTPDGRPDYRRMAALPAFRQGLARLLELAAAGPTAVMCSEEDPLLCHRRNLIAHALRDAPVSVLHIRKDGRADPERWDQPQQLPLPDSPPRPRRTRS